MTSTSSNPQYGVQRFFEEFRLPDYTLDSFSGRLLDVVANTAFSSGNVQVELHHAITRLLIFAYLYIINLDHFTLDHFYIRSSNFVYDLCIFLDCLTYWKPGMCHFIDREADLSRSLPSADAYHLGYEIIRGDRQRLKSNFL